MNYKYIDQTALVLSVVMELLLMCINTADAQTIDSLSASFARKFMHYGDLVHYLEQENSYTIYQGVYQGQWADADPLIFSVQGNSYRNNKFYFNGMRIDDRFNPGSSFYRPNLEANNLSVNYRNSSLYFNYDRNSGDYVSVSGNFGNLRGVSHSSERIVHWFHGTGTEGAYDKEAIKNRQHTKGAGKIDAQFSIKLPDGESLRQHVYATFGKRKLPNICYSGLNNALPLYEEGYSTFQMDGQLPNRNKSLSNLGYLFHFSTNGSFGSAHYLNKDEVSDLTTLSATLYGKRNGLISGLTYSANRLKHHNLSFERNIIDQDGESLYPWSPDGTSHEVSWYLNYHKPISPWVTFHAEGYNSMLLFNSKHENWSSLIYEQHPESSERILLYSVNWQSRSFGAGLLENSFGITIHKQLNSIADFSSSADISLDGFLLRNKSHLMPHWQTSASIKFHPSPWFTTSVNLGYDRISYTMEHIRYFSNDYLNGKAYFHNSHQLAYTTGGLYHKIERNSLSQPSMFALNIPIVISNGHHELMNYLVLKKFFNPWMTSYKGGALSNGYISDGIFYQTPGESLYSVGHQPLNLMGDDIKGVPYFIAHMIRYSYTGQKLYFSASWQSMQGAGPSALGVGPFANDIGVLDESTANPNTHIVIDNKEGKFPAVGRFDQDKAYVARLLLGVNVCDWFSFNSSFKWTDGQPFSPIQVYNSDSESSTATNHQRAFVHTLSRGINPTDGNFGCRESAIFNFDLTAIFYWKLQQHDMSASVYYYNSWDYGNVLNEYMFPQNLNGAEIGSRGPNMCLTVPGGIICSVKMNF